MVVIQSMWKGPYLCWNFSESWSESATYIFYLMSQRCDTGTFWTISFFGGKGFNRYLQISRIIFCNHFWVKGLWLSTFFCLFYVFFLLCLCDAGTFKFAACLKTIFCAWYSFVFFSRLPKVSSVALLWHNVWLLWRSYRNKTLFCNPGTLCLSWVSFVHEKLVCRGLYSMLI